MSKTFTVYHPSYAGDEGVSIEAYDFEYAAEQYAQKYDSEGDYSCVAGYDLELRVVDSDGIEKIMIVTGETVPSYSAREKRVK